MSKTITNLTFIHRNYIEAAGYRPHTLNAYITLRGRKIATDKILDFITGLEDK